LLAEDHLTLTRLLERAESRPDQGAAFWGLLRNELTDPLRILWLVDRLRVGTPLDAASLKSWIGRIGAPMIPMLLWAIESMDPGPGQDLLCRCLAPLVVQDAGPILKRLEEPNPRHVAALCCVLEAGPANERSRAYQKLLGRRDPQLTMQVMTGRARAKSAEVMVPLEAGLGDKSEEIRLHAVKLLGDLGDPRAVRLLLSQTQQAWFEKRSDGERAAFWAAICASSLPEAINALGDLLSEKVSLLNKKKVVAARLPAIAGIAKAGTDEGRGLLERLVADRGQPDEVVAAAKAALAQRTAAPTLEAVPSKERRSQLRRSVCLEFLYLTRAAAVVDLSAPVFEPAFEHFREEVRSAVMQNGKLALEATDEGLKVNTVLVPFGFPGEEISLAAAGWLKARDVKTFSVESPVPAAELRAYFLQAFDPDAGGIKAPHVRSSTFSGNAPRPPHESALPRDAGLRVRELCKASIELLNEQRAGMRNGRSIDLGRTHALVDEWAFLFSKGACRLLSLIVDRAAADAPSVHGLNSALVAMAFASDLQLGQPMIRDAGEMALLWALPELPSSSNKRPAPGAPAPEELRLKVAEIFISQIHDRRAPAFAVAALEAGLDAGGDSGRTPSVLASIVSLAEAWDSLAVGAGLGHAKATDALGQQLRKRFSPELLDLFCRWATAQAAHAPRELKH